MIAGYVGSVVSEMVAWGSLVAVITWLWMSMDKKHRQAQRAARAAANRKVLNITVPADAVLPPYDQDAK